MAPSDELESKIDFAGLMQDRRSAIDPQIGTQQNILNQSLIGASAPDTINTTQLLQSTALKLVPLILGLAIAKEKGGQIGAEVGLSVGGEFEKDIEKETERSRVRSAAEAKHAQEETKRLRKEKADLDTLELQQAGKGELQELSLKAADIRNQRTAGALSGGLRQIGTALAHKEKRLDINKKERDKATRDNPIEISTGGETIRFDPSAVDPDNAHEVNILEANYGKALGAIDTMAQISASTTGFERSMPSVAHSITKKELFSFHQAISGINKAQKARTGTSNASMQKIEKAFDDPNSIWQNIVSGVLPGPTMKERLLHARQVLTKSAISDFEALGGVRVEEAAAEGDTQNLSGLVTIRTVDSQGNQITKDVLSSSLEGLNLGE